MTAHAMSAPAHLADAAIAAGAAPPSGSDELASSHVVPSSRKSQYPLETPRYALQHFGPPDCVEMLFAHLKRILRLGRLRLRGPRGAQFEFSWQRPRRTFAGWSSSSPGPPPLVASYVACLAGGLRA